MASNSHPSGGPSSLEEIHGSVPIPPRGWRRFLAFSGPAVMVSVGYMDPGNWGTDLEAGSKFGYRLLWVLAASNLMAILLQGLSTRLGVVMGRDLAQACRDVYPRWTAVGLWVLTEIAIAATDLAEVIGTVVALKLLFGLPYLAGLAIAAGDTLLLLALQRRGVRLLELLTLALVGVIAVSFVIELSLGERDWMALVQGLVPGFHPEHRRESLYVAIAMLGATVMPHNLYLHSALVQTRAFARTEQGKQQACRYNLLDSVLALNGALFINAAILVLAASTFTRPVESLAEAPEELKVWGEGAAILFAVALLASGQSSTLTGTLAGQVVMEGFIRLRIQPWLRRLVTRLAAIVPALVILSPMTGSSDEATDGRLMSMLVLSQAILSFQLPFAILPLVQLTSDRRFMGRFASGLWLKGLAWGCAAVVVSLNAVLIWMQMEKWAEQAAEAGWSGMWVYGTVGPLAVLLAGVLGWVGFSAYSGRPEPTRPALVPEAIPGPLAQVHYRHIGVAVELNRGDSTVLAQAAALARQHGSPLLLIHVVEGTAADVYGPEADDEESRSDRAAMAELVEHLRRQELAADGVLGYGVPADELVRLARQAQLDLLVLGTHGHRFLADLALGQTVSPVLHRLDIPILVVPTALRTPEREAAAGSNSSASLRRDNPVDHAEVQRQADGKNAP
jgi:manganese transport protein